MKGPVHICSLSAVDDRKSPTIVKTLALAIENLTNRNYLVTATRMEFGSNWK
jgi:hypothetical protein